MANDEQAEHLNWLHLHGFTPEKQQAYCMFIQLCRKANVWQRDGQYATPKLIICKHGGLNASTNMLISVVRITDYDLQHLSSDDMRALLAHEVGHLVQQKEKHDRWFDMHTTSVLPAMLLSACLTYFSYISLGATLSLLFVAFIMIVCLYLTMTFVPMHAIRREEYQADATGMCLVGLQSMCHLMQTCVNHEKHSHDELKRCTKDLWTCPLACMRCTILLLAFDVKLWLDEIGLSNHPAYRDRVKHMMNTNQARMK